MKKIQVKRQQKSGKAKDSLLQKNNLKNVINEWLEIIWAFNMSISGDINKNT
jgi:hypothetical protein